MEGKRTDVFAMFADGVPKDVGWAIATYHEVDDSLTRTCKGCGVTSRDRINRATNRVEGVFHHTAQCPVMNRLASTGGDGGSAVG